MPLANAYLESDQLGHPEPRYPLCARVCDRCLLVQVESVVPAEEIFSDYAYFSSYSDSWVEHGRRFAEAAQETLNLGPGSLVLEVASNDGYLLRHFVDRGIPVLGVEPAANVAEVAEARHIPTEVSFFGERTARELSNRGFHADLVVANNVLAHVPDLHDFVTGLALVLKPAGVVSIEVPHLGRLISEVQFDTIYHEHFSYFSLATAEKVLAARGLLVFDVEELATHGGSLRIWAGHRDCNRAPSERMLAVRTGEQRSAMHRAETYSGFMPKVEECRRSLVRFLAQARAEGRTVVAYGAAAKGNTLLNFCATTEADVAYVADRSPFKQGRFLPGTHLPVVPPERVAETRPDYLLILPWNLRAEVSAQMDHIRGWGGRFVTAIPEVQVHP
jgi:SAM-dependent methyltransferase